MAALLGGDLEVRFFPVPRDWRTILPAAPGTRMMVISAARQISMAPCVDGLRGRDIAVISKKNHPSKSPAPMHGAFWVWQSYSRYDA
jgi:hypothetical protein